MAPGISIRHVRHLAEEDREIRTDIAGFVGVVTPSRWPRGARHGDVIEVELEDLTRFEDSKVSAFYDRATIAAVRSFFANGGSRCTVFGVLARDARDLVAPELLPVTLRGLMERLREDEEINLLAMPPLAYLPRVPLEGGARVPGAHAAVVALLKHCRQIGHRFLVIDGPRDATEDELAGWVARLRREDGVDASYGALYHPWLMQGDLALPPSGSVVGMFARTDLANAPLGVRVAPANQEIVGGVTHLAVPLGWREGAAIVERGINPILEQPGRGLVVWGARTLSADPRWQQITARRIVSLVTERVRRDAEWVVFEQQRPELWETVARMVRSRLDGFWSAGLLSGDRAGSEYLVQCDEELNPPAVRDAGQVHFKVLLRPVSTTEFIEVELQLGA